MEEKTWLVDLDGNRSMKPRPTALPISKEGIGLGDTGIVEKKRPLSKPGFADGHERRPFFEKMVCWLQ
jgi:hypothetical protein